MSAIPLLVFVGYDAQSSPRFVLKRLSKVFFDWFLWVEKHYRDLLEPRQPVGNRKAVNEGTMGGLGCWLGFPRPSTRTQWAA